MKTAVKKEKQAVKALSAEDIANAIKEIDANIEYEKSLYSNPNVREQQARLFRLIDAEQELYQKKLINRMPALLAEIDSLRTNFQPVDEKTLAEIDSLRLNFQPVDEKTLAEIDNLFPSVPKIDADALSIADKLGEDQAKIATEVERLTQNAKVTLRWWQRVFSTAAKVPGVTRIAGIIKSLSGTLLEIGVTQASQYLVLAGAAAVGIGVSSPVLLGVGAVLLTNLFLEIRGSVDVLRKHPVTGVIGVAKRVFGRTLLSTPGFFVGTWYPGIIGGFAQGTITGVLTNIFMSPSNPLRALTPEEAQRLVAENLEQFVSKKEALLAKEYGKDEAEAVLKQLNQEKTTILRALAAKAATVATVSAYAVAIGLGVAAVRTQAGQMLLKDLYMRWQNNDVWVAPLVNQKIGQGIFAGLSLIGGTPEVLSKRIGTVVDAMMSKLAPNLKEIAEKTHVTPEFLREFFSKRLQLTALDHLTFAALAKESLKVGFQVGTGMAVQNLVAVGSKWQSLEEAREDMQRFYGAALNTAQKVLESGQTSMKHLLEDVMYGGITAMSAVGLLRERAAENDIGANIARNNGNLEAANTFAGQAGLLRSAADMQSQLKLPATAKEKTAKAAAFVNQLPETAEQYDARRDAEELLVNRARTQYGFDLKGIEELRAFEAQLLKMRQENPKIADLLDGKLKGLSDLEVEGLLFAPLRSLASGGSDYLATYNLLRNGLGVGAGVMRLMSYYYAVNPGATQAPLPSIDENTIRAEEYADFADNLDYVSSFLPSIRTPGATFNANLAQNPRLVMEIFGYWGARTDAAMEVLLGRTAADFTRSTGLGEAFGFANEMMAKTAMQAAVGLYTTPTSE